MSYRRLAVYWLFVATITMSLSPLESHAKPLPTSSVKGVADKAISFQSMWTNYAQAAHRYFRKHPKKQHLSMLKGLGALAVKHLVPHTKLIQRHTQSRVDELTQAPSGWKERFTKRVLSSKQEAQYVQLAAASITMLAGTKAGAARYLMVMRFFDPIRVAFHVRAAIQSRTKTATQYGRQALLDNIVPPLVYRISKPGQGKSVKLAIITQKDCMVFTLDRTQHAIYKVTGIRWKSR